MEKNSERLKGSSRLRCQNDLFNKLRPYPEGTLENVVVPHNTQPPSSCASIKFLCRMSLFWERFLTRTGPRNDSRNRLSNVVSVPGELVLDDCDPNVGGVRGYLGRQQPRADVCPRDHGKRSATTCSTLKRSVIIAFHESICRPALLQEQAEKKTNQELPSHVRFLHFSPPVSLQHR